jgi:hypothetical protein
MLETGEKDGVLYGAIRQVASPEERTAVKQTLDAQLAKVKSRVSLGASGTARSPTLAGAAENAAAAAPTAQPRYAPSSVSAAVSVEVARRPREPAQFHAPEGVYIEHTQMRVPPRLSRRSLSNLTPPPSLLASATVGGNHVLVSLLRGQITWYIGGKRSGLLDEHDLGGRPCAVDIGEAVEGDDNAAPGGCAPEEPDPEGKAGLALVLGLSNGEVVVYFAQSRKMWAFNTERSRVCASGCLVVRWTSTSTFMVAHTNGAIFKCDLPSVSRHVSTSFSVCKHP